MNAPASFCVQGRHAPRMFARPARANGQGPRAAVEDSVPLWTTRAFVHSVMHKIGAPSVGAKKLPIFIHNLSTHIHKTDKNCAELRFFGLVCGKVSQIYQQKGKHLFTNAAARRAFRPPARGRGKGPPRRRIFGKIFFRGQNPLTNFKNTVILFGYAERQARRPRGRFARTCALSSIG